MLDRIYLIEAQLHHEVLDSLIRMSVDSGIKEIHCICSILCKSYSDFKNDGSIQWLDINLHSSLQNIKNEVIILTSLDQSLLEFHEVIQQNNTAAYIHNLNNFTKNKLAYISGLKSTLWRLRSHLQEKKLKVIQSAIKLFLIPHNNAAKKITYLPFAYPGIVKKNKQEDKLTFTIPGVINNDRREYIILFDTLIKIDERMTKGTVFNLLGKPFNTKVELEIKKTVSQLENIQLNYWTDYIDQKTYDQMILESSFLLLPIKERIQFKSYYETRGKTCVSGNINDMVKYGIPAIIPSFYPLDKSLESLTTRYTSQETLIDILLNVHQHSSKEENITKNKLNQYKTTCLDEFKKVINLLVSDSKN